MADEQRIAGILNDIRPEFDFTDARDFITAGLLDSFDMMTLVSELDSTYGIRIPGTEIVPENFENVTSILALVRRCRREA
jgi:methoxymalonate biosynthesis acyl carrier protein